MTEWTPEGQADQTPKSLGLRIIRRLRETFIVNEMRLLLFLERLSQQWGPQQWGQVLHFSILMNPPVEKNGG